MAVSVLRAPPFPIGTPGQAWGAVELAQWRAQLTRPRRYADDVLEPVQRLRGRFEVETYGELVYGQEQFGLKAVRCGTWVAGRPAVLVTAGVHGYETSGVHGALQFLAQRAHQYADQLNLLVVPCVSPWGYERIQRWNFDAVDPNRSFLEPSPAQESAALMRLIAPHKGQFAAHIDLHETTDSDATVFSPAKAARDGQPFEAIAVPDGFYLVDDEENPQPAFQQAIIEAVSRVTHIAPADPKGEIIGSLVVAPGVIRYPVKSLGLCTGITGARYTTTTEVYPDSPRATPEQCNGAQVAAVCAALDFVLTRATA